MRKIPATMATQHPDNASAPYWGQVPFISTLDEVEECYRVFSDLGCDEYMWDWEGKFVDEAVVDRLFNRYPDYFHKNQLGRDKFLTFRIPNIWEEKGFRLARSFMTIITAAHTARERRVHTPPLFEVILPMTTRASQLIEVEGKFRQAVKYERAIFEEEVAGKGRLEVIPLIEGSATLLESRPILRDYVRHHERKTRERVRYLRPFIARSDPALDAGFLAATLSARGAISEYYRFQEETGVRVFPILGAGCPLFRGGLAPDTLDRFLKNYAGVRTVTIQSGFRYDYPLPSVKKAIATLKKRLPLSRPTLFSEQEVREITYLSELFARVYRPAVLGLAPTINDLARFIPQNRERIPHTGHFGYSRKVGMRRVPLPRAITFVATFASLGIPPALIGVGRGLREAIRKGHEKEILKFLPTLQEDLVSAGHYLNWENLKFLSKRDSHWEGIREDVMWIEKFLGKRVGPARSDHYIHRNLTSNIYHLWRAGKKGELKEEIVQAARVRRSLG